MNDDHGGLRRLIGPLFDDADDHQLVAHPQRGAGSAPIIPLNVGGGSCSSSPTRSSSPFPRRPVNPATASSAVPFATAHRFDPSGVPNRYDRRPVGGLEK